MVPVELTLRNFLSYGDEETTLDFRSLHLACLSGENGHGKSALLDAITWSLWGETRLGKQGHEQLIRIGADEMSVVFAFKIRGDLYRVRRQRGKRSGGQIWELQQSDGNGNWRPLTGVNASDTGRIIQQLLRMSYDTFLNSAYLKQGRADEFVRQTSNKRKEILCEILELSRYDRLEEKAKQRAKIAFDTAFEMERDLRLIDSILAEENQHLTAMAQVERELSELATERDKIETRRQRLEKYHTTLENQRERAQRIHHDLEEIDKQLQGIEADRAESRRYFEGAKTLLADAERIERDYQSLVVARDRAEKCRLKVKELRDVEQERFPLVVELKDIERELNSDLRDLEKLVAEAQHRSTAAIPLRQSLLELERERRSFTGLEEQFAKFQEEFNSEQTEMALLKRENTDCEQRLNELSASIVRLKQQTEACSVCGSPLPAHKIADLIAEREAQIALVKQQQADLRSAGTRHKTQIQRLQAELKECDNARTDAHQNQIRAAQLEQQLRDIEQQTKRLPEWEASRSALALRLDTKDYAPEIRARIAELDALIRDLSPFVAEQESNARIVTGLERADTLYQSLQTAQGSLFHEQKILAGLDKAENDAKRRQADALEEQQRLGDVEGQFREVLEDLKDVQRHQQDNARKSSQAEQERGRLRQSLDNCAAQRADRTVKAQAFERARKEEDAYKQLAGAFGKRGVQADIIENALPELQNYANELLDRLTDGDMSVHIDTQKQAKAKNAPLIETLEIQISDSLGTRQLEMYSGGEAFRVSFALRIALSKLLARRAGADLQTLIVDEGFGTQDAKGREKLIDAVSAIQADFEKILVITHIDELKDAFPARIEVVKTPSGSQLSVVHGDGIG